jgi:hypothetical protein
MKAEIISLDPTGVEIESRIFEIPLIGEVVPDDGIIYKPTQAKRYILKIGEYSYWIKQSGELFSL